MKNALPALAFSTALLLLVPACHKNTGEAPGPADAATGTSGQALGTDAGATAPAGGAAVDAGGAAAPGDMTGGTGTGSAQALDAGAGGAKASAAASGQSREACLDQWLKTQRLDTYGHAEGTMYAGGSPLFNERTGQTQDRFEYVARRHPAVRTACGGGAADGGAR